MFLGNGWDVIFRSACLFLVCSHIPSPKMPPTNRLQYRLFVGNNVGNVVFLAYIIVEIHQYRLGTLEIRQYYRKQIHKMIFVGAAVAVLLSGVGFGTLIFPDLLVYLFTKGIIWCVLYYLMLNGGCLD